MRKRTIIAVPILASALITAGCKQEAAVPEPIRPVLSTVVEHTQASGTSAAGIVEPRFKSDLSFRVVGRLISRPVNVGDFVAEGQILATLDATTPELAVRSARAGLSKAQAQLAYASAAPPGTPPTA